MIANINACEGHEEYIVQIYQEHYARLQHYFLLHLGNTFEADDCVQETIRRFFFFMEDREWNADVQYIQVYLMRIAGLLCSRKLAEKKLHYGERLTNHKHNSFFTNLRTLALQAIKERVQFIHFVLRPVEGNNK